LLISSERVVDRAPNRQRHPGAATETSRARLDSVKAIRRRLPVPFLRGVKEVPYQRWDRYLVLFAQPLRQGALFHDQTRESRIQPLRSRVGRLGVREAAQERAEPE